MIRFPNGSIAFNNFNELLYDYFIEMDLMIGPDQYVRYAGTNHILQFKGKLIKASYNGQPVYGGLNDVVFDPIHNYGMISTLFGLYLDMCQNSEDGDILQGYIAHYVEDNQMKDKQRVTVKTNGRGEISSNYYKNVFLAYMDCTFKISGYPNVDLSNFDIDYNKKV